MLLRKVSFMGTSNLKSKTRKELANEYGVTRRTLFRWLLNSNIKIPPGLIKPRELDIIYKKFGTPK